MSDYKSTLNLPSTKFPMKANLTQREPQILKRWQDEKLYEQIREQREGCEKFILHDGPPYANGNIHLGHSINRVLKDIIIKAKTISGFDAPFVPGWDCHGLPIEHNVEKKIGKAGVKVDHKTFRKKCREYAAKQVAGQKADFVRLGLLGDWENPYLTMDFEFEADIIRSLGKIAENGHLVKGFKPVYWSVVGASALAEAEVEYKDKVSYSIDVRFSVFDQADLLSRFDGLEALPGEGTISVVIWTTTPWTLPSNQAVSLNTDLEYILIQHGQERLIIAEALLESVTERAGLADVSVLAKCTGSALEHLKLNHPFYEKQVPVILGSHVTTDAGTGCVHTAPDHGVEDFVVGKKYDLSTLNYVNASGLFIDGVEIFAGEHVYKVDAKVVALLEERGNLLQQSKFSHSYPHCWRTKTPLIYRATPQWFISMKHKGLLDSVKSAVEEVTWLPDWGKARIDGMLESSPDWCISRQRTWGVPIALFIHKDTQQLHPETGRLIEEVALLVEQQGIDAWFDLDSRDLLGDEADSYEKVTDTLDVWFDSGVTHQAVLNRREQLQYPADLYLEGSDQHRGWFQSSLKTAMAINGSAPYKAVLTHGFTVDENGHKMSKSIGNTIAPSEVINEYGADVLRLWVAATDYSGEITVAKENFKRIADSYRRIRNTARFLLSNLSGFEPDKHVLPFDELLALDKWAIDQAAKVQDEIIACYDNYQFHQIYQKIHNFCIVDMGGFYLDIIKDRQYTTQSDSQERRSVQTALFHIANALVRWIAPILSFTADEIWRELPGQTESNVFVSRWYSLERLADSASMSGEYWQFVAKVKNAVNKAIELKRGTGEVGSSLAAQVTLYCSPENQKRLALLEDELRFVLITSSVNIASLDDANDTAQSCDIEGLKITVERSKGEKCVRCWHHQSDVGKHEEHPELCHRCIDNVAGDGEKRRYA
ncbi:MAG: isoleucine--tRNA ligase [Alteromonadaceae bacterium]|nr:MAG: isoleucine--tRNA ligase [Alteromonadaceae bacterium]